MNQVYVLCTNETRTLAVFETLNALQEWLGRVGYEEFPAYYFLRVVPLNPTEEIAEDQDVLYGVAVRQLLDRLD